MISEIFSNFERTGFLHHACLIVGEAETAVAELKKHCGSSATVEFFDSFGIAESRRLKTRQSRKAPPGERQFFILVCNFITREAQQALLKIMEEPNVQSHFFIVVPSKAPLLPAFLSRFQLVDGRGKGRLGEAGLAERRAVRDFLARRPEERLELAGRLAESYEQSQPDGEKAMAAFLNGLEAHLAAGLTEATFDRSAVGLLSDIRRGRNYLRLRLVSPRLLLEHLALISPYVV